MTVKAKLKTVLFANDVEVADSEDASLWQNVLVAIQGGKSELPAADENPESPGGSPKKIKPEDSHPDGNVVAKFAKSIGVTCDVLTGALRPSNEAPYIHLDDRCWETLKRNRGPGTAAPVALAGTVLALWFEHAGLGNPTKAQAQAVLRTLSVRDKNPSRSIKNCEWLQSSGEQINVNAAKRSLAVAATKAFCCQEKLSPDKA